VSREGVADNGNQGPDVLDTSGLGVEVGNDRDLIRVIGVREDGLFLGSCEVVLDWICSGLILLPHEGSSSAGVDGGKGGAGRDHVILSSGGAD
jgi:hypothetical protein